MAIATPRQLCDLHFGALSFLACKKQFDYTKVLTVLFTSMMQRMPIFWVMVDEVCISTVDQYSPEVCIFKVSLNFYYTRGGS